MGQQYIRQFSSRAEYDAFMKAQWEAVKQRNIEEALQRARAPKPRSSAVFTPKIQRSSEELKQYIEDVLARRDVQQAQSHARRYARTVRLVQGGSPGLGHR